MDKYDALIIDTCNVAYKIFSQEENNSPTQLSRKFVYKDLIIDFVKTVENLKEKYLHFDGHIYFLIDNYTSKLEAQSLFFFTDRKRLDPEYKASRNKGKDKEFFNTINFLRYYYMINSPSFHTIKIDGLEADDLVKPLIENYLADKKCLLLSSDLDWTRYLSPNIDWLQNLGGDVKTQEDLSLELGFPVTERNIILYKALFGDLSDNIPPIIKHSKDNLEKFSLFVKEEPSLTLEDISLFSREPEQQFLFPFLRNVAENEKRYFVNIQLISSVPISLKEFKNYFATGSNNTTKIKIVREALELDAVKPVFSFGPVKRTRI